MVERRGGETSFEDQSGWSLFAGGCQEMFLQSQLILRGMNWVGLLWEIPSPTFSPLSPLLPLKDFDCERHCHTAIAQTDTKTDIEKVRAGPLAVSGGEDIAPPKATVVKLCLPQVMMRFGSVPSQAGF